MKPSGKPLEKHVQPIGKPWESCQNHGKILENVANPLENYLKTCQTHWKAIGKLVQPLENYWTIMSKPKIPRYKGTGGCGEKLLGGVSENNPGEDGVV